jgi:pyruvate/2-oxoglutarate/acetoin dehydrogenase E1 component
VITAGAATTPHAWPPIAKRSGSLAAEICTRIVEQAFWELDAPIGRVCSEEVPISYPRHLENAAIPQAPKNVAAAKAVLARS